MIDFATPLAGLAALAGVVPVAVALQKARAGARLKAELGLPAPSRRALLARPAALACVFALLGLAAAQPSIRRQHERLSRTDAQLQIVLDNSRSMLAASSPGGTPRYRRAAAFARRLHGALPQLAVGVSALNNRLLPYLFPTVDDRSFLDVIANSYGIQRPPPALDLDHWVTSFGELEQVTERRFYSSGTRKRLLVVLSDAETRPFDARHLLHDLRAQGTTPVVVRFWQPGERIFHRDDAPEAYRATQPDELQRLRAAGWPAFSETQFDGVVRRIRQTLGSGPLRRVGYLQQETTLAPMVALAALAPLLLLFAPAGQLPSPGRLSRRASRRYRPASSTPFARATK